MVLRMHPIAFVSCALATSAPALHAETAAEDSAGAATTRTERAPVRTEPARVLVALSGPDSRIALLAGGLRDALSRLNVALTLRTVPMSYIDRSLDAVSGLTIRITK